MHHLFMIKIMERLGLEDTLFNIISTIGMENIIVNEEQTWSILTIRLRNETRTFTLFNTT